MTPAKKDKAAPDVADATDGGTEEEVTILPAPPAPGDRLPDADPGARYLDAKADPGLAAMRTEMGWPTTPPAPAQAPGS